MDEVKQYKTAGGFRAALETRLQKRAHEEATDLQRLRRQVAFQAGQYRYACFMFPPKTLLSATRTTGGTRNLPTKRSAGQHG